MNKYVDETAVPMSPLPGGTPGVPATQNVPDVWPIVPVRTVKQIQRRSDYRTFVFWNHRKYKLVQDEVKSRSKRIIILDFLVWNSNHHSNNRPFIK